jgi:hypothetical protein
LASPAAGEPVTDADARDELKAILVAGHTTTASALAWTWYVLSEHPDAREQLEEECRAVRGGRAPGVETLPRLSYTRRVIAEVLRLYPPTWLTARMSIEDDVRKPFFADSPNGRFRTGMALEPRLDAPGIDSAVITRDFEEVIPKSLKRTFGGVYGLCAYECIVQIGRWNQANNHDEPVSWVFEAGTRGSGQVMKMFEAVNGARPRCRRAAPAPGGRLRRGLRSPCCCDSRGYDDEIWLMPAGNVAGLRSAPPPGAGGLGQPLVCPVKAGRRV